MTVTLEITAACVGATNVFGPIGDAPGNASKALLTTAAGYCPGCLLSYAWADFTPYPGARAERAAAAAMEQAITDHLAGADEQTSTLADMVDGAGYGTGTVLWDLARLGLADIAHRSSRNTFTLTPR